jgi:hypothetical protein
MSQITDNERALLAYLYDNEWGDIVWVDCICDDGDLPFDRDGLGGVMASLTKKGLASTWHTGDGDQAQITEAGCETFLADRDREEKF